MYDNGNPDRLFLILALLALIFGHPGWAVFLVIIALL